jgi:dynein heavy chain
MKRNLGFVLFFCSCFFGDCMIEDPEARLYDEILDIPALLKQTESYLDDFNGVSKRPMNLAIFLFAVEHVSRICRILKQPGGHMLLVGVGGSGRQSLTRLGAAIYSMEVFQVFNLDQSKIY